jgi:ribosomal protein S18 acetylase RimI-like enzyme
VGGVRLKKADQIRLIEPSTPVEFRRYYDLRWRTLRAPWNQPRGSEADPLDAASSHLMAVNSRESILGVGRLDFTTIGEARIRYMGVAAGYRRRGIGTLVLCGLEQKAIALGAVRIVLDAREAALGFYRKHGYTATGPGPTLFNRIAHVKMEKRLSR